MNSLMVIHPYKYEGIWVFDDAKVGLLQEPFVSGADVAIDYLVKDLPEPEKGFTLIFSAQPFPGFQEMFEWRREGEYGGNWYYNPKIGLEGWLCPALFKYFDQAPEKLFVQVKAKAD